MADENTAIAVDVVPGQEHDAPHLEPMLDKTQRRVPEIDEFVGDKGFDGEPQRQACRENGAKPVIPYRSNSKNPGRLNKKAYGKRNMVERLIGKMKEFRRVATRYDKLKQTFLATIHLVLGFIRLRHQVNVNGA